MRISLYAKIHESTYPHIYIYILYICVPLCENELVLDCRDIDEKFRKRARGERYQGPLTDFSEKTYVPNFNVSFSLSLIVSCGYGL